jgi:predicted permease
MSNVFEVMFNVVSPVFLIVGLAMLIGRRFALEPRTLSRLLIYLFSPALVLDGIAKSGLGTSELGKLAAVAFLSFVGMGLVAWALTRLLRLERRMESAFMLSIILVNAGNFGIPLNTFAFGEAGQQRAVIFYVVSAVIANTIGIYLASRGSASARDSLLNVFKVPLVYGLVIGLIVNFSGVAFPLPVQRVIELLGQAAVPTMLVVLGLQLGHTSITSLKGHAGPMLMAAGTRLLIAPVMAAGLVALVGLAGVSRQVAIIEASMPTAVMAGVLATEFDSEPQFVTTVVMVSTLASLVTLSVLLTLVG